MKRVWALLLAALLLGATALAAGVPLERAISGLPDSATEACESALTEGGLDAAALAQGLLGAELDHYSMDQLLELLAGYPEEWRAFQAALLPHFDELRPGTRLFWCAERARRERIDATIRPELIEWAGARGINLAYQGQFNSAHREYRELFASLADELQLLSERALDEWMPKLLEYLKYYEGRDATQPFVVRIRELAAEGGLSEAFQGREYQDMLDLSFFTCTEMRLMFNREDDPIEQREPLFELYKAGYRLGQPLDAEAIAKAAMAIENPDPALLACLQEALEYEGVWTEFLEAQRKLGGSDALSGFVESEKRALIDAGKPWLSEQLVQYYQADTGEDALPRYTPAAPRKGCVLLVVPEEIMVAPDYREKVEAQADGRVQFTNDPDEASAVLFCREDFAFYAKYGDFGGVSGYSTTLSLTAVPLAGGDPVAFSATRHPGSTVSVPAGSGKYYAPYPDLTEAEGWAAFVDALAALAQ